MRTYKSIMFQTVWALHIGDNRTEYWTSLSTATRWLIQHSAIAIVSSGTGDNTYPYINGIQPLPNGKARITDYRFYVDEHMLQNVARNIGVQVNSISKGDWSPLLQQCVRIRKDGSPA